MSTVPATKIIGIGPPGPNGTNGADYFAECTLPQGIPGLPGLHGIDGLDYPAAGSNGSNAPQHTNPLNGTNGNPGNNSQNGLNGTKGPPRHWNYYEFTQDGITGGITLIPHGSPNPVSVFGNVLSTPAGYWLVIAENAPAETNISIETISSKVYYLSDLVNVIVPFARRNRTGYILQLI